MFLVFKFIMKVNSIDMQDEFLIQKSFGMGWMEVIIAKS